MQRLRPLILVLAVTTLGVAVAGCGNLLAAGQGLTCVVVPNGAANCFGANADGQAGHSEGTSPAAPGEVALPTGWGVVDIAVGDGDPDGDAAVCAATAKRGATGNVVRCWGDDDHGQLGRGAAGAPSAVPVTVAVPGGSDTIGVGAFSACAIASGVVCWGDNTHGQLGTATRGIAGPAVVRGTASFRAADGERSAPNLLAVGDLHVCAGIASAISCWGHGASGQLGDGATADRDAPVRVRFPRGMAQVSAISAGGAFTCGIFDAEGSFADSHVWCWGANESGQLGDGSTSASSVPVRVGLPAGTDPASIATGRAHACAVAADQGVWCWGANGSGQLGDGTLTASATPKRVARVRATLIAAGADHACAATPAGALRCWGGNASGQLGAPAGAAVTTPVAVAAITGLRAPVRRGARVAGRPVVGGTLRAATRPWRYAVSYGYEWQRRTADGWTAIDGATRRTLRVRPGLAGAAVRVRITGRNAWTEAGAAFAITAASRPVTIGG